MESTNTRPKNNRNKGFLFHCFRSHDIDYDLFERKPFENAKTTDPLLTYIAVADKEGIVFPTILSSALKSDGEGNGNGNRRWKKANYGFFGKALKVTLNETSWGKKIIKLRRRKRNKGNIFISSTSNLEGVESDKISNTDHKATHQTNSNTSSSQCSLAFTPSSLTSSTTTVSSSPGTQAWSSSSELYQPRQVLINGIEVKKQKQDEGYYCSSKFVVCLPLISLVALILWGKFYAILCTSIGLFLVPPRRRRPGTLCGDTEFDSVQYKKKIIMEGLLERRRRSHI